MINISRLYQTTRHLRPRQIIFQLLRRVQRPGNYARTQVPSELVEQWKLPPQAHNQAPCLAPFPKTYVVPATFAFLNLPPINFGQLFEIDWNYAANGKLWTYNLNYFEYLRQPELKAETGAALIAEWVAQEDRHLDGWEPYPTSLRIINWLQFYRINQLPIPADVIDSLCRQQLALWNQLEYHLDGNHLLENALALVAAGQCNGYRKEEAHKLLSNQLNNQYLQDGAHYERSIMYHATLLYRQLDVMSLIHQDIPSGSLLRASVGKQLGYLEAITDEYGQYPHFNDSVGGVAPPVKEIFALADLMGIKPDLIELGDSGYRRWDWPSATLWMDVAAIGPDHIPGHAHADNLTFCLTVSGQPIIVDPAISTYEKNTRRTLERSTALHNTVEIGGRSSSDVWGGFRVGRRAYTTIQKESSDTLVAAHDGYPGGHQRTFTKLEKGYNVTDKIEGAGTARFNFDHTADFQLTDTGVLFNGGAMNFSSSAVTCEPYLQATGFNQLTPAHRIVVEFTDQLSTSIHFTNTRA